MFFDEIHTALGCFTLVADQNGLCQVNAVSMDKTPVISDHWIKDPTSMKPFTSQLKAYFNGESQTFNLPLNPGGTIFQNTVWSELLKIPYGETRSYQDIAKAAGNAAACRAVGLACGKNPLLIVIPCHRVIGKNGSLTGFGAGIDLKKKLLLLEKEVKAG